MADERIVVAVIDDDDAVRDSLGALLEAEGYEVDTYASGPAFLDALPDALPACALVDVRMPEMDGLELQRRLADAAPTLPVIIITGHGDIAMAVRAIKAGPSISSRSRSPIARFWTASRRRSPRARKRSAARRGVSMSTADSPG